MRVFFTGGGTGGHLYPALAIARALVRQRPEVRPHFIGAARGIEREILPSTEFPHTLLDLHPFYRQSPWKNWRTVMGLTSGWWQVDQLAKQERPHLVVATGGYAAGAALAHATMRDIPFVIQEQNSFPGKTVSFFSRWAREVYLGFPEAVARLPASARHRALHTGNPIEPPPDRRVEKPTLRQVWGFADDVQVVVLAFGGSQGSAAINSLIASWIDLGVPPGVGLIWGTGRDHYARYAASQSGRVVVRAYLSPMADAYAVADVAVARAGAMTTAELCAWGIPMCLIPLPSAAADHQTANARALANAGAAIWTPQREATASGLDAHLRPLLTDPMAREALATAARARSRPDASRDIAQRIAAVLDQHPQSA